MKNLILIGFMGSGKSTVGKRLAEKLGDEWIDMDQEIEKSAQKTVKEIFDEHGESYFRDLETNYLKKLAIQEFKIISVGGGIILRDENIELLKEMGTVIFLHATPAQIILNTKGDETRPLLQGEDFEEKVHRMLEERDARYLSTADIILQTTGKDVDNIVDEIISLL